MADPVSSVRLDARVRELEQRVRLLEDALAGVRGRAPAAPPASMPPYRDDTVPASHPPTEPQLHESMETRLGMRWFNRLGALTVLVGLLLGAGWASRHGYLGPELRYALAGIAALVVFGLGARALGAPHVGRRTVGLGVTIVGGFALYFVPWAAAHVDRVLPVPVVAALGVAITAGLAVLAWRTGERTHAWLAAAGGLGVPLLARTHGAAFVPVWAWLSLLIAASLLGVRGARRGRVFAGVGLLLAPGAAVYFVAVQAMAEAVPATRLMHALLASLTLLGFVAARADALYRQAPASRLDGANALLATLGCAALILVTAQELDSPGLLAMSLAALAVLHVALALALRRHDEHGRATGASFALGVLLALLAPAGADASAHTVVLAAAVIGALALVLARRGGWRTGQVLGFLAILVAGLGATRHLEADALGGHEAAEWLTVLAALAVCYAIESRRVLALPAFVGMHACALTLLLRAGVTLSPGAARLWSSLAPLAYALALLAFGVVRARQASRLVGLVVLLGVIGKVFLVDVWQAGEGVRIAAFLALGLGLLAASFLYGRLADR